MANLSAFGGAQPITPGGLVELGHTERTTDFTTTQTAFSTTASHNVFSTDLTVVCDGGPVLVEFFVRLTAETTSTAYGQFALNLDGVENARCATSYGSQYVYFQRRITPSAGSHTFNVCPYSSLASTLTLYAGAGGSATAAPMFLRVSKIVQQNDGLKPVWTPPIVTQLPTNPSVGDTVIYAADATNGVYWHLYYDGLGSYPWKYVGGSSLKYWTSTTSTTTSGSFVSDSNFAGFTIPLAGDYEVTTTCLGNNTVAYGWFLFRPNGCGYDTSDYRAVRTSAGVAGGYETASHFDRVTLTTGTLGGALRQAAGGTVTLATRSIKATPVRVA